MTIGFLDVDYRARGARAACVIVDSWEAATLQSTYVQEVAAVERYEPGNFYRRELPCLLSVLHLLPSLPDFLVVDGYVWLPPGDRPGLGAHLYEALGRGVPVMGIAKTAFAGVESAAGIIPVLRGVSRQPLFVTAVGMETEFAAQCVRRMAGQGRIPDVVKAVDRLAKGMAGAS